MSKQVKVLCIGAPIGSGHLRAAAAVCAALRRQRPDVEVKVVHIFDFFPSALGRFFLRFYLLILACWPALYGSVYGWSRRSSLALWGRNLLSRYLAARMFGFIKDYAPTAIVCTHASPAGLAAVLLQQGLLAVPVFAVVTDFVVHRLWVYPEICCYFVADEASRGELQRSGIPPAAIRVSGIPVAACFTDKPDRSLILASFGFCPDKKTVLIMGGGGGLLEMAEILAACDDLSVPLQIIAVAGKNEALFKKLCKKLPFFRQKVRVLGYTNRVHECMAIADILISKSGGVTAAEALSMELPMLIYKPLPGQERVNMDFLLANSVAVSAKSLPELVQLLSLLLEKNSEYLAVLRRNTRKIRKPFADSDIAATIFSHIFLDGQDCWRI